MSAPSVPWDLGPVAAERPVAAEQSCCCCFPLPSQWSVAVAVAAAVVCTEVGSWAGVPFHKARVASGASFGG
jgi:hypothetical protein